MRGFTLIEALVVVSLLTIMTSLLILYNRTGEKQLILIKEKTQLVSTILKAKNLALGALVEDASAGVVCGYGVYFDGNGYFIYRDLAGDCNLSDHRYTADNDVVVGDNRFLLNSVLKFTDTEIQDILFQPPTPDLFFDGSAALDAKTITIKDVDNENKAFIIINQAGQINVK